MAGRSGTRAQRHVPEGCICPEPFWRGWHARPSKTWVNPHPVNGWNGPGSRSTSVAVSRMPRLLRSGR
jgi:hypothetical protein